MDEVEVEFEVWKMRMYVHMYRPRSVRLVGLSVRVDNGFAEAASIDRFNRPDPEVGRTA